MPYLNYIANSEKKLSNSTLVKKINKQHKRTICISSICLSCKNIITIEISERWVWKQDPKSFTLTFTDILCLIKTISAQNVSFKNAVDESLDLWATYFISAASKCWSAVNYHQSLAFDWPYLSCNGHCDRWLFQEIFHYFFQKQLYTDVLQNRCY